MQFRDSIHELKIWIVELALATIASLKATRESLGESAKHKTAGPKKVFSCGTPFSRKKKTPRRPLIEELPMLNLLLTGGGAMWGREKVGPPIFSFSS